MILFPISVITALNFFDHPVSHKNFLNFYRSCFPTTLSKPVRHYLEIIEASLLHIQAKTFADNHRFFFTSLVKKKSEKSGLYG